MGGFFPLNPYLHCFIPRDKVAGVWGVFSSCSVVSLSVYLFPAAYLQVKVMVRVCPVSQSDAAESSSFLKVDPRKKQITIMDPSTNQTLTNSSQKKVAANQVPPKMFTFDAAFPPDASQVKGKRTYPFHDLILKDKQVILIITNKYKKGGLPHLYEGISKLAS